MIRLWAVETHGGGLFVFDDQDEVTRFLTGVDPTLVRAVWEITERIKKEIDR